MATLIEDTTTRTIVVDSCGDVQIIETPAESSIAVEDPTNTLVEENIITSIVLEDTAREIIALAEQGPQGPPGIGLQVNSGAIAVSDTVIIDQISITLYRSVKWLVTIKDLTNDKYQYSEIAAIHANSLPYHFRVGKIGDTIITVDDVDISGGNLRLKITNNHTDIINVSALRLATLN